jgi:hypothetical protein
MQFTFFEFENFKGLRSARLNLAAPGSSARVFTLVGLNESGKTTVLEAIDHFQSVTAADPSPKHLGGWRRPDHHALIPIAERINFNGKIMIRCGVSLDDSDVDAARATLRSECDGYRLEEMAREMTIEDQYIFSDSRFVRRANEWHGVAATGRRKKGKVTRTVSGTEWDQLKKFLRNRLPTIWFFPNFLFEFPDRINIEEHEDETSGNRFYRALFQDILDALDKNLTVETHIVKRARSSKSPDRQHLRQVLLEASRHVTKSVVSAWNAIFADKPISEKKIIIDLEEEDDREVDELGEPVPGELYVTFRVEDDDGLFSVGERSLGFRWFFVYLLITTYRGRRKGEANDILFLFDEPASNLHSTAQSALLASLDDLARKAVIIYTTHSHHLIKPTWLGSTFVIANRGVDPEDVSAEYTAKRTDIQITPYRQFAAQHPNQSHYFQPILDVLEHAPSALEYIPGATMVEGKSDFYLLTYFQEQIARTDASQRLNLMPGGGAGTLDDLFQLYIGWARPFVALLDSDKAGMREHKRYLEKFGRLLEIHLIDLAAASGRPKVKGIESLLSDKDKLEFQRVIDPGATEFHKKTFALGVQEAVVGRIPVNLYVRTEKSLAKVHSALRERLAEVERELQPS